MTNATSYGQLCGVDEIRSTFIAMLSRCDRSGTTPDMLEIVGASFAADDDHIFVKPNSDYIRRELEWYTSMSLNVCTIPGGPPKIWRDVAAPDGSINSNYGHLVYSMENYSQYRSAVETLTHDCASRRAVMIYTRPSMQYDFAREGMSDFVCTNVVQYLIRDNMLHVVVQMRSNDAIFGYRNDYAWQRHVQEQMVSSLSLAYPDISIGTMTWQVGSLHIYPRHYDRVRKAAAEL